MRSFQTSNGKTKYLKKGHVVRYDFIVTLTEREGRKKKTGKHKKSVSTPKGRRNETEKFLL